MRFSALMNTKGVVDEEDAYQVDDSDCLYEPAEVF